MSAGVGVRSKPFLKTLGSSCPLRAETGVTRQSASGAIGNAMSDSRTRMREGCLVHGQISSPELPAAIDCTVWDISREGARLILPEGATIPDKIRISTPFSSIPRTADVCWRAGAEAGIRLLDEGPS